MVHITSLRGLACLLLVLFHVVGNTSASGLRLPSDHWLAELNSALAYLRMPLFAVISGYVYAIRPVGTRWQAFAQGKARRLLLPLLSLGTLFGLVQMVMPGVNASRPAALWMMHIVPVGHFWYLQAMLLVFAMVAVFERLGLLSCLRRTVLMLCLATSAFAFLRAPGYFSIDGSLYLLPFFLGGLAARRFQLGGRGGAAVATLGLLAGMGMVASAPLPQATDALVRVTIGLSASYLLFASHLRWAPLEWVGRHSYGIFLMHVFFTAPTRIMLLRLGVDELALLVPLGVLAGVAGPMAIIRLLAHAPVLRMVLLGERMPATAQGAVHPPLKA